MIGIKAFLFYLSLVVVDGLKVSIFYEALCPDSVSFIAKQLYPTYSALKSHLQLDFVPYGKASHNSVDNKWQFSCQHGRNECTGNKYQSCALNEGYGQDKDVEFVNCVMRQWNPSDLNKMKKCADDLKLNWTSIATCGRSVEGDKLLAKNGDKTPYLDFVPTIVYDDVFSDYFQEKSLRDFGSVVCGKIPDKNKPKICENRQIVPEERSVWDVLF